MDCKSWESHTGYTLEYCPLQHHTSIVIDSRDVTKKWPIINPISSIYCSRRSYPMEIWMKSLLIPKISLVSFVAYIPNKICPRYAVCSSDKPWVGDRAEGLSDIRCIRNVAMSTEKYGSQTAGIGSITKVGVGGCIGTEV